MSFAGLCLTLPPHGLQHTRLFCPWNSTGKNTGVREPFSSPGDFPHIGIKPEPPRGLTPIRIAIIKKTNESKFCLEGVEKLNSPALPVGM